jgi:hypothetical protein
MLVSINVRVRGTSETLMSDVEVQYQRYRTRHIREVTSQLDVLTLLTSTPSHLLCFHFVCCVEKVSDLTNRPVVRLLGVLLAPDWVAQV